MVDGQRDLTAREVTGELRYPGAVERVEGEQAVSWLRIGAAVRRW